MDSPSCPKKLFMNVPAALIHKQIVTEAVKLLKRKFL